MKASERPTVASSPIDPAMAKLGKGFVSNTTKVNGTVLQTPSLPEQLIAGRQIVYFREGFFNRTLLNSKDPAVLERQRVALRQAGLK